jgi:two-component system sensor histidine kinase MtrB
VDLDKPVRSVLGLFARSLQARAVAFTIILSGTALVVLGGFLSYTIGNGLYQTRTQQILAESTRVINETQNTLSSSAVVDEVDVQTLMNALVPKLELTTTNQTRRVAILRSPVTGESLPLLQSPVSADLDVSVISASLRTKVQASNARVSYQSVQLQDGLNVNPGLVVGAQLVVPLAGNYEVYLVYDLQNEQQTLNFMQRTLVIGGLILIVIIGMVAFFVTDLLVKPVQLAAEISQEVADGGELDKRMPERGTDVVAVLGKSFNRMTQKLQRQIAKLESVSQTQQRFVSDVSHELRTPMTTILMASENITANAHNLDADSKKAANLLKQQVVRFDSMLKDLLEISRYDAGQIRAKFVLQDLNDIVRAAIGAVSPLSTSKETKIRFKASPKDALAEFDHNRIDRVLGNLLTNAIEHGEGKPIDVEVAVSASAVAVTVRDRGIGMTEENLQHVFDRFWRADPSRQRTTGGTGLGLAISLEDTNIHNGWLQVWSRPNEGALFRLTLPKKAEGIIKASPLPLEPRDVTNAKTAKVAKKVKAAKPTTKTSGDKNA